jgi:hypothetical protein
MEPDIKNKLDMFENSLKNYSNELNQLKLIVKELSGSILEKLSYFSTINEKLDVHFKFLQTLNMLLLQSDQTKVEHALNELNRIVMSMRHMALWNTDTSYQTVTLLHELSINWKKTGNNEIAKILEDEAYKYQSETHNQSEMQDNSEVEEQSEVQITA